MESVKETKEMMVGFLKLAALLAVAFKDGVQATDILDVLKKIESDPVLKQALLDAYNGIDKVPAEVKDMSMVEGIELISAALPELAVLIAALKKA